jgi:hypothetical protein
VAVFENDALVAGLHAEFRGVASVTVMGLGHGWSRFGGCKVVGCGVRFGHFNTYAVAKAGDQGLDTILQKISTESSSFDPICNIFKVAS